MDVRVLGPIEVHGEYRLAIGGPRQRRILAALAMHPRSVVSTDRLAEITWSGEELPEKADVNLRSYVYRLRNGLGPELAERLETRPPGYVLRVDSGELDHERFAELLDRADRVAEKGDPGSAVAYVDEAMSLWRGAPYEEFASESWVEAEAVRLVELRTRGLERRSDALVQLGRAEEAVGLLETIIDEHPYRERPRRLLMTALYAAGRQTEALRSFQEFRQLLVDEVGIDPSEDLAVLERQILQQDPALPADGSRGRDLRSYQLEEVIGEGAFAMVWNGTQPELGRSVAVKQIRARLANDPDFIRRFEVEAQLVSSLEHPHIVPLYDYWREPDAAFLVMRLLRGGSLEDRLRGGPLDEDELRRLVDQIGSALRLAHRSGVVHRDVKPANVMLDEDGNFYLTDFGIAFGVDGEDDTAAKLSTGSPPYAAPEQLRREQLDARTDIYSFGVTLFHAAAGSPPFADAGSEAEVVERQLEGGCPRPSKARPDVPAWVDTIVARSTATNPSERYHEIDDLIVDAQPRVGTRSDSGNEASKGVVRHATRNPFKGLSAFQEADAPDFHGRERLVDRCLDVLRRPGSDGRLLAVVGPSGSGKSSVVRAGLVPALRAGVISGSERWYTATMVPGSQPYEELESALTAIAGSPPGPLASSMADNDGGIGQAVRRVLPEDRSDLVLVIDQFEELFTLTESEAVRTTFLDGLLAAIRDAGVRLRIVVTIRADFYDRPLTHPRLAALLETSTVTVSPLAADELERAITGPVDRLGLGYEPGLVARITADVTDQPGGLPLLQFALTELFEHAAGGVIPASAYDEIGGIGGALARRAEQTYVTFSEVEQRTCRRLLGRLVTLGEGIEDTRRRITIAELGSDSLMGGVVASLGAARLLTFDRDLSSRLPTIEIAHEALLQAWPRLGRWLEEDRDALRVHRRLTMAAVEWSGRGRSADELYRGGVLEGALALRDRDPGAFNDIESAFVDASAERAARSRLRSQRRTRMLQGLLAATSVLLVIAVVATLVAIDRANDADAAADEARDAQGELAAEQEALLETQQDLETELIRTRIAGLAADGPPMLASLLAVELHTLDASAESLDLLADTLLAQPGWKGTLPGVWIDASPLGPWVVSVEESAVVVRDPDDLSELRRIEIEPLTGASGQVPLVPVIDPSGRRMAVGQPGGLRIVDLLTGEVGPLATIELHHERGRAVTWASDGAALVAISGPQSVDLFDVDGLAASQVLKSTDLGRPLAAWAGPRAEDTGVFVTASTGELIVLDTSRVHEAILKVAEELAPIGARTGVTLSEFVDAEGAIVNTTFGSTDVFDTEELAAVLETEFETEGVEGWAERLEDGTVFVSGGLGGSAVLIDAASDPVGGPWVAGGGSGALVQPVLLRGGDELALVLTGSRTGTQTESGIIRDTSTIHRFSLVGGDVLSSTLPPFPNSGDFLVRPYYLPDSNVLVADASVWRFDGRDVEPVDLGVPIQHVSAHVTNEGEVVVVSRPSGEISVHEMPSGRRIGPNRPITVADIAGAEGLAISADLRHLVVASLEPTEAHVFDLATGERRATFPLAGEFGVVSSVRAGQAVVLGFDNNRDFGPSERLIVDLDSPALRSSGPSWAWDLTSDGDAVVETRADGISLVDIDSGEVRWAFQIGVPPLQFAGSERYLVGSGFIESKIVDVEGEIVVGAVNREGLSRYFVDGTLTQIRDGRAHVWNIDPQTWPEVACEAAGRNLTRREWATFMPGDVPYAPSCEQWPIES